MNLRVLLIESEAEELLFLEEVLREIEQERWLPEWPRIEPLCAATWAEAERIVSTSAPHAILLNVEPRAEIFRSLQAAAPDIPVMVLVEAGDEALGARLMRDGAEDFLFKRQVDCALLAHALRNAVLRHRLLSGGPRRSAHRLSDGAGQPRRLPGDGRARSSVGGEARPALDAAGGGAEKSVPDLPTTRRARPGSGATIEAAEHLRGIATPADLVARIGDRHFAMSVFDGEVETAGRGLGPHPERRRAASHWIVGAAIFERSRPRSLDALLELALADLPHLPEIAETKAAGAG